MGLRDLGNGVEGVLQRVGKGDRTEVFGAEILRAVAPPAAGLVHEDVLRFEASVDGCRVGEELEG